MTVTADLAMSLDGYIAGPNVTLDNPGGDGAEPLFEWIHNLASWRERQGMSGGEENRDSELMREWFDATGAVVMGRIMYDTGEEFWGDNPPFRTPVFVLTHRPRPTLVKQGGTTFTFVSEGIHSALQQAKAAAGRGTSTSRAVRARCGSTSMRDSSTSSSCMWCRRFWETGCGSSAGWSQAGGSKWPGSSTPRSPPT